MQTEDLEGQVLAGKYRVERVLGVGGMGIVVSARHLQLDERVAIKFMRPEALTSGEAVARFAREARAAVKIKSEHVARVSDVGTLETGAPYMVMEYLEGSDLSAWLTRYGRLPIEQAVEFVLQAGEALAEAHSLGIVHRDLKPANLFVIREPSGGYSVKVLDFGISKMNALGSGSSDFNMTKTSALLGSPLYMSPEQMRGAKEADARSDIWALGVILYELISGGTPFPAETFPELVLKIATEAPEPLFKRSLDVPPGFEAVLFRCLEKDPNRRFATVSELAQALIDFAPPRSRISVERISGVLGNAGFSVGASSLPPAHGVSQRFDGTAASWGQTKPSARRGRQSLVIALASLTVVVFGIAAYAVHRSGVAPAASAGPSPDVAPSTQTASAAHETPEPSVASEPLTAPSAPQPKVEPTPSVVSAIAPVAPAPSASDKAPAAKSSASAPSHTSTAVKPTPVRPVATNTANVYDDRK